MSDAADFANDLLLKSMDLALAARKPAEAQAASMFCVGCGNLIPWQRRFAVANCVRCMSCQTTLEVQGGWDVR
jgi:phage/conjugal plasmid C-4 type zinc finger TraR family protein